MYTGNSPGNIAPVAAASTPHPLAFPTIDHSPPVVRCRDCRLDLEPGLTLRAAFGCPRFGKPRWQHSGPCESFVPKAVL